MMFFSIHCKSSHSWLWYISSNYCIPQMETLDFLEVRFIGVFICALLVSMILLSIYLSIYLLSMIISHCQVLSASLKLWKILHCIEWHRSHELWLCCLIRKSSTQGSKPLPASVLRRNIASHEARYFLTYYSISYLTILYLMIRCIIQIIYLHF